MFDWMRLWRMMGWLGLIITLLLSLLPPVQMESGDHADKIVHLTGYALLMFWWAQVITHQRWKLAVAVVLFGLAIEGLQGLTPNRMPDLLDALANSAGVLIGWLAARALPSLPGALSKLFRAC